MFRCLIATNDSDRNLPDARLNVFTEDLNYFRHQIFVHFLYSLSRSRSISSRISLPTLGAELFRKAVSLSSSAVSCKNVIVFPTQCPLQKTCIRQSTRYMYNIWLLEGKQILSSQTATATGGKISFHLLVLLRGQRTEVSCYFSPERKTLFLRRLNIFVTF